MKKKKTTKSQSRSENHSQILEEIPKRRLWIFRIISLTIVPLIFFSLLEISLRLFNFGYPTTALVESQIADTTYVQDNSDFAYRFFPKQLAQEFVPLRFKAEKPENVFRIFILGESAAQGIPEPAYSFGRILDVMLKLRFPNLKFEILPLAMTAINSHVVLEIAKDCLKYKPDLFIVYMGNNEVVGPYGPGTVLTPILSNSFLLNLTIDLNTTKISQLITLGLEKLNLLNSTYNSWKGMEMFLQNKVQHTDPGLEITYRNFEANLESLNNICNENNIKIIYSTVASNLKDCPPFNSMHRAGIKQSDIENWNVLYASGTTLEEESQYSMAITKYLAAEKIDDQYADLLYKLGRCYMQTGNSDEALKSFTRARDFDCIRFRPDSRINQIIRGAAANRPGTSFLADAASEVERNSPDGIPGNEFLYEHVHLNFEGNYLIAKSFLEKLEHILSNILKNQKTNKTFQLSDSLCATYLGYNDFERRRILELVLNGFIKKPPFTNQLNHSVTVKKMEAELDSLQLVIKAQGTTNTINIFENALRIRPSDWLQHDKYADYLAGDSVRMYQKAADHYRYVMQAVSHDPNAYVKHGIVLAKLGKFEESLNSFQQAAGINPTSANVYFNSGLIYQKLKKWNSAIENYEKATLYEPTHSKAYNNMALIFCQRGDTIKALETIDRGLKVTTKDLPLNYNKALILYKTRRRTEAINQLRHLIMIAPKEVKLQNQLSDWLREEK